MLCETVKVAVEGCDHVVTEMYGVIALLKRKGRDLESHTAVYLTNFNASVWRINLQCFY